MSMQYIRDYYGVPAKRGGMIRFMGDKTGKIVGTRGPHLRIRLDGERIIHSYHPRWNIEYLSACPDCDGGEYYDLPTDRCGTCADTGYIAIG